MKPICLDLKDYSDFSNLTDINSHIEELYHKNHKLIFVLSSQPEHFKNNHYVSKSYKRASMNLAWFENNTDIYVYNHLPRLLVIVPHMSTGGCPQVTLNKVELLKSSFNIQVVEYAFYGPAYVVQRNKMIELIGENNFHSLGDDKVNDLINICDKFKPEIISIEEFPEMFMVDDCADYLYSLERRKRIHGENVIAWKIVETTHDSSFNIVNKRYTPDQYVFVSAYSLFKCVNLKVAAPMDIVEYPVDRKNRDKLARQKEFSLDPNYKHVVTVGLFTARKNQGYAFEMARQLEKYKVKFHFLGNMAGNFEDYWQPLMVNKPDNCITWGERSDVSEFLQACDMFLFPSKGDRGNKELNPIAIKEALEYDMVKMMYNLDVYCNKYDDYEEVVYLTGDVKTDINALIDELDLEIIQTKTEEQLIIIGTYPNLKERVNLTKKCIESYRPLGRKIMLVSHYPVDQEIQKMVDYYVYDAHNPLTHHTYYKHFYNYTASFDLEININTLKDSNQSLTVLTNLFNGFKMAKSLGYKRVFYNTFDVILHENDQAVVDTSLNSDSVCIVATLNTHVGTGVQTNGMMFDVQYFLNKFDDVRTPDEYNKICEFIGAENFLEDYLMNRLNEPTLLNLQILTNPFNTLLINSGLGVSSNSEYYSILPILGKTNTYVFYFYTYNIDNRVIYISIGNLIFKKLNLTKENEFKYVFSYTGEEIDVVLNFYDGDRMYKEEVYKINDETLSKYNSAGWFKFKNVKPKIKLVHIQTTINDDREKASRDSLIGVTEYGWEYKLHLNEPYKSIPPVHSCLRPTCVSLEHYDKDQPVGTALTPGHYGCYEAFKNAILTEFHDCDYLMICEGDCLIETDMQTFIETVERCTHQLESNGINYMSFGDIATLDNAWPQSPVIRDVNNDMYVTDHIIGLQCIMFPAKIASWLKETVRMHKWDAADMYFNTIFAGPQMGIVKNRLTTQADGYSLIDNSEKIFIKKKQ
jgi:glycosyltransferase involved in cell wall biosynthesis